MTTTTPTHNKTAGIFIVTALAATGVGFLTGSNVERQKAVSNPAPTVVTTTQAPPVVTNVVPEVCLMALDEADKGFEAASVAFGYVAQAFDAIAVGDWDKVNTMATKMSVQSDKISKLKYREYADACRAEA